MTAPRDRPTPEGATPPRAGRSRAALIAEVGALVRKARAKRGVTRKVLAKLSGTSERYLAQIEAGDGNPSVLVLDAIAHGLGLSLADLLPLDAENATRRRAMERLLRAPPPQVEAILHLLDGPRGSVAAGKRGRRLALVGLRGAGKSTLGAALAERLTCPFIELDKMIESDRGAPVAILVEVYGPAAFRRYERDSLDHVIATYPEAVIATAGGIVADETTFARLLERTHVVWLRASPADHMRRVMEQGDFRPMGSNQEAMADLVTILEAREPDYGRAAAELMTSGLSIEESVETLMKIAEDLFARCGRG